MYTKELFKNQFLDGLLSINVWSNMYFTDLHTWNHNSRNSLSRHDTGEQKLYKGPHCKEVVKA